MKRGDRRRTSSSTSVSPQLNKRSQQQQHGHQHQPSTSGLPANAASTHRSRVEFAPLRTNGIGKQVCYRFFHSLFIRVVHRFWNRTRNIYITMGWEIRNDNEPHSVRRYFCSTVFDERCFRL